MTAQEFVYWLQGFLEISEAQKLNAKQVQVIKDHIALVLHKVTPDRMNEKLCSTQPFRPTPTWIDKVLTDPRVTCTATDGNMLKTEHHNTGVKIDSVPLEVRGVDPTVINMPVGSC